MERVASSFTCACCRLYFQEVNWKEIEFLPNYFEQVGPLPYQLCFSVRVNMVALNFTEVYLTIAVFYDRHDGNVGWGGGYGRRYRKRGIQERQTGRRQ